MPSRQLSKPREPRLQPMHDDADEEHDAADRPRVPFVMRAKHGRTARRTAAARDLADASPPRQLAAHATVRTPPKAGKPAVRRFIKDQVDRHDDDDDDDPDDDMPLALRAAHVMAKLTTNANAIPAARPAAQMHGDGSHEDDSEDDVPLLPLTAKPKSKPKPRPKGKPKERLKPKEKPHEKASAKAKEETTLGEAVKARTKKVTAKREAVVGNAVGNVPSDNDDDDDGDDDLPLLRAAPTGRATGAMKGRAKAKVQAGPWDCGSEDDSDDDVPLARRVQTAGATAGLDYEYDDDDDVPLALMSRPPSSRKLAAATAAAAAAAIGTPSAKTKPSQKRKREHGPAAVPDDPAASASAAAALAGGAAKKARAKAEPKHEALVEGSGEDEGDGAGGRRKFDMPGQTRVTPAENDPARLFYSSMYHEKLELGKPSRLAQTWMLKHGLLERHVAKRLVGA